MAKKAVLILAAAMLSLVIMSSEVVAMELALNQLPTIIQEEKATETDTIENAKYGRYENNGRGKYTRHIGGYVGSGAKDCKKCCVYAPIPICGCCNSANEAYDVVNVGIPHNKVVIYV